MQFLAFVSLTQLWGNLRVIFLHVVLRSLSVMLTQPQQQPAPGNGAILAVKVQEYAISGTIEALSLVSRGLGQSEGKSLLSALLTSISWGIC